MRRNFILAVALFAGSIAGGQSMEPAITAASIGEVRSIRGIALATQSDGTSEMLKIGDPLYVNDVIETKAGGAVGLMLIDGTAVALGEDSELVLDEFVYDRATCSGNLVISLTCGAAEFISGQIAKSGKDHMVFKTPVATIGVRGTKVFVAYNPVSGKVTIINRPVDSNADNTARAGKILLSLLDGTSVGHITTANGIWHWDSTRHQAPVSAHLTEAQALNIVAAVENVINAFTRYLV
jgi:hypothetical protein